MLDENKIAIICCTNNEEYMSECIRYISHLAVPKGMEIELLTINGAKSMTAGYNEGMKSSNAKYKLYIHQDTFLIYSNLFVELISFFREHSDVGMVGAIGTPKLPRDGVMWHGNRVGNMFWWDEAAKNNPSVCYINIDKIIDVEAVDGMFIATQTDIYWREDLFKRWDFYDISQAQEMKKAGFRVVVPPMTVPWVLHDCHIFNLSNYHKERLIFLNEYFPEYFKDKVMRFLYPRSSVVSLSDIPWALLEMGNEVFMSDEEISLEFYDETGKDKVYEMLENQYIDIAISHDFSPDIARACYEKGIPYISWAFDAPLLSLYSEHAKYNTNYIFCFDKIMMKQLENKGIPNMLYMPLATNMNRVSCLEVTKQDENMYSHEISMVGNLYEDNLYPILLKRCEKEYVTEVEKWINDQIGIWTGENQIHDYLSDNCIEEIKIKNCMDAEKEYGMENRLFYESLISRELTHRERVMILNRLAEKYHVHLYSGSDVSELRQVICHGKCDYNQVTPKIFHLSKINLNITLRSIESGIPQRIYDIMSVGGFVLTNYQPEIDELFEKGKDLVVYHNLDELLYLTQYYLENEEERIRIAMNGYKKVKEKYSYTSTLEKMIADVLNERTK